MGKLHRLCDRKGTFNVGGEEEKKRKFLLTSCDSKKLQKKLKSWGWF